MSKSKSPQLQLFGYKVRNNLNRDLLDITQRLRSQVLLVSLGESDPETLRTRLETEYREACYEAAKAIIPQFRALYLVERDVLDSGDEINLIKNEARRLAKRTMRKLLKPVSGKLKASGVQPLKTEVLTAEIVTMMLRELDQVPDALTKSRKIMPRKKAAMGPLQSVDLKILFLAANPSDTGRLALDEEAREIGRRIKEGTHRDVIKYETRWAIRLGDIYDVFNEYHPTIVHFSGHGVRGKSTEGIQIVGEDGSSMVLGAKDLQALFAPFGRIQVVVLNACHSEIQARAISKIIDFTVGMSATIPDDAAIKFSSQFYSALAHGQSIVCAFEQAVSVLEIEYPSSSNLPRLLVRTGVDEAEGDFLRAPESVDLTSLGDSLNRLSRDFFAPRRRKIAEILEVTATYKSENPLRADLLVKRIVDLIADEKRASETFYDGLSRAKNTWEGFLIPEAVNRINAVCDHCSLRIEICDGPAHDLSSFMGQMLNRELRSGLASVIRGSCENLVVQTRILSGAFTDVIEYLPPPLQSGYVESINWNYRES